MTEFGYGRLQTFHFLEGAEINEKNFFGTSQIQKKNSLRKME